MLSLLKAIADPTRLRLLALLAQGDLSVQDLTTILAMGQSRISRHLRILLDAGLLQQTRQGTWCYYRLDLGSPLWRRQFRLLEQEFRERDCYQADLRVYADLLRRREEAGQRFFQTHGGGLEPLQERLLPFAAYGDSLLKAADGSGYLVEVGIGSGRLLVELAARAERVCGIDQAPAMLDASRRRLLERGIHGVELRLGNMGKLPLQNGEVDTLVLNMVLHHAQRPAEVCKEVARVLRPGGRLLLADLKRHDQEWARAELNDQWLGFEPEQLQAWLREAGFVQCEVEIVKSEPSLPAALLLVAHNRD